MRLATILLTLACPLAAAAQNRNPQLQAAEAAQQSGDLPTAIHDYQALLQHRPNFIEAHVGLAAAYAQQNHYDQSIAEFKAALALTKTPQPDILLALGQVFYKKADYPDARQQFQAVVNLQPATVPAKKLRPVTIEAITSLGETDLKLNDPDAAYEALLPRSYLAEQDLEFARVLGLALVRTGKRHDGAAMLHRVGEASNRADLLFIAGVTFLDNDEVDDARQNLEVAHKIDARLPGLGSFVGIARERSSDPFAAEASFRQVLKTQPNDFFANLYLGAILLRQHKREAAKPYLDRAFELQPALYPTLAEAVIPTDLAGELAPAIAALEKSDQTWPEVQVQLASLTQKLSQH